MFSDMLEAIIWWISGLFCHIGRHAWNMPLKDGRQACVHCGTCRVDPKFLPPEYVPRAGFLSMDD